MRGPACTCMHHAGSCWFLFAGTRPCCEMNLTSPAISFHSAGCDGQMLKGPQCPSVSLVIRVVTQMMKLVAYLRNLHIKHSSFASFEFSHSRKDLSTCSSFGWVVLDLLHPYLCPYCENKQIALLCACDTLYFDNIQAYFFLQFIHIYSLCYPLTTTNHFLGK